MKTYSRFAFFIFLSFFCTGLTAQSWVQEASLPSVGRQYCTYFSIGAYGYIGFGNNTQVNDLWQYDPSNNTWTQKAALPVPGGSAEMVSFVIGNFAYVGMGLQPNGYAQAFWKYDPSNNTWSRIADFPGQWTRGPFTFTIGTIGYVGSGSVYNDLWQYDPSNNTWTQKNSIPTAAERYFGVGFGIGNYGYAGSGVVGSTAQNDFWQYDPVADSWTQKANVGGGIRVNGLSFQTATKGYIALGHSNTGTYYNDVWEYDPTTGNWTQQTNYPGAGQVAGAGFTIGCKAYIGVGFNTSYTDQTDLWALPLSSGGALGITADTAICQGSSVNLTATGGTTYTWSPNTSLSSTTGATVTANPASTITYTVTSSVSGCVASASVKVTVNQVVAAAVSIVANPSGPICAGTPVSYTATPVNGGNPSYQWKVNGADSGTNSPMLHLSSLDSGDVITCIMTAAGSCITGSPATSNSIVANVISHQPAGIITANPDTICSGTSANLTDVGSSGAIHWQSSPDGLSFATISGDSTTAYTTPNLSQSEYYRVSTSGSCGGDTSPVFKLVVDTVPAPVISARDSAICNNDSTIINSFGSYTSYLWNNNDTRSYTYANTAGNYWLTVTDAHGCSAVSSHLNMRVYPVSSVSIIEFGDTLSSYGANAYQWIFADTNISGATSPVYLAQQTGYYSLQVVDTNGCTVISNPLYVLITGVEDISGESRFNIYPNPTGRYIFIHSENAAIIQQLEIYDALAQRILIEKIGLANVVKSGIDISGLSAGTYFLKIRLNGTDYIKPFVKQ